MIETLTTYLSEHGALVGWLGALSVAMFVGGLLLAPWFVIRLPADFFVRTKPRSRSWTGRHPVGRLVLHGLKNALGVLLVLLGIAMLLLPGQGLLTILLGLGLIEFPGKRRVELAIVRLPPIRRLLNGIRSRAGRPPFQLPEPDREPPPADGVNSRDEPGATDPPEELPR